MNLEELQKRAHETAVAKGWHESDELGPDGKPTARQKLAWLALVTDELDEAAEERKAFYLEGKKPCGEITEIADALIRMLDASVACGWKVDVVDSGLPIHSYRTMLVARIRVGADDQNEAASLMVSSIIDELYDLTSGSEFESPEFYIKLKMDYNDTRPHRHGGKLA